MGSHIRYSFLGSNVYGYIFSLAFFDKEFILEGGSVCSIPLAIPLPQECPQIRTARLDPNLSLVVDGGNSHGSVVEFACQSGFRPSGETLLTCQAGAWSHPFPSCEGRDQFQ